MTPPPINIDGTNENYSNVTIDGQDVEQITIDGQDVLSAIPDSDLAHWYDATEVSGSDGDSIGTWEDKEGTDDLSQSTSSDQPTLKTGSNGINSNNVLETNGSSEFMDVSWSAISEPYHMFFVIEVTDNSPGNGGMYDGINYQEHEVWANGGSGNWRSRQPSDRIEGNSYVTSPVIHEMVWRGSNTNDILRINGTQQGSNDCGSSDSNGLTIGKNPNVDDNRYGPFKFAEIAVYDVELNSSTASDVRSYLSDKWGT